MTLVCVDDYEAAARMLLARSVYDYCAGGSGSELTLRWNREDFHRWRLVPRAFSSADCGLAATVAGQRVGIPIGVSAVSLQRMTHADAEVGLATGAAEAGSFVVLSSFSSEPAEAIAAAAPGTLKLQQLYLFAEPALTASLAERAEVAGFAGFVVTADTPRQGIRRRDRRHALDRFTSFRPALCDDPVFRDLLARRPGRSESDLVGEQFPNSRASWDELERFCASTSRPVYVKGVQHPGDLRRAADAGAAGIVVSNHGGRQLDRADSAIHALELLANEDRGSLQVLFDSGIRSGTDAFIALALGADAVLVGRPAIWGLAIGGAAGVAKVLTLLADELSCAMAMTGASTPTGICRSMLWREAAG